MNLWFEACSSELSLLLPAAPLQGQALDVSFSNCHGCHAVGHIDDFQALQQQILEGSDLIQTMKTTLHYLSFPVKQESSLYQVTPKTCSIHELDGSSECEFHHHGFVSQKDSVRKLLADSETVCQIVEEAKSLLRMFWRVTLPNTDETKTKQVRTKPILSQNQ